MPEIEPEQFKPEAKFNQGMVKVYRLNEIRMGLHKARERGDIKTFYSLLKCWRSELNFKADKDEREKADKIEHEINNAGKGNSHLNTFMGTSQTDYYKLHKLLDEYELFLGDLEKTTGLGSPDKDDDEGL